jgi:hypothetical protein
MSPYQQESAATPSVVRPLTWAGVLGRRAEAHGGELRLDTFASSLRSVGLTADDMTDDEMSKLWEVVANRQGLSPSGGVPATGLSGFLEEAVGPIESLERASVPPPRRPAAARWTAVELRSVHGAPHHRNGTIPVEASLEDVAR